MIQYGQGVRKDKGDIGNIDLIDVKATPDGLRLSVGYMGQTAVVEVSLLGKFQAENLLCAVGLAVADGVPFEAVIECVSSVVGVRGRMELVGRSHSGAGIYVDYAHTPDALQSALQALRFHISGRLHCRNCMLENHLTDRIAQQNNVLIKRFNLPLQFYPVHQIDRDRDLFFS